MNCVILTHPAQIRFQILDLLPEGLGLCFGVLRSSPVFSTRLFLTLHEHKGDKYPASRDRQRAKRKCGVVTAMFISKSSH